MGGGVGDGIGGIKDGSAAAAAVVVIVPSPANAINTVPPVAAVVSAAAARTAEVRIGYPVDSSDAAVERHHTHNDYQRIHMVWYRARI